MRQCITFEEKKQNSRNNNNKTHTYTHIHKGTVSSYFVVSSAEVLSPKKSVSMCLELAKLRLGQPRKVPFLRARSSADAFLLAGEIPIIAELVLRQELAAMENCLWVAGGLKPLMMLIPNEFIQIFSIPSLLEILESSK